MTTEKKQRRPYKWGAKAFLTSMEVGETRILDDRFTREGLRGAAVALWKLYDCRYVFRTNQKQGYRQVTRIA